MRFQRASCARNSLTYSHWAFRRAGSTYSCRPSNALSVNLTSTRGAAACSAGRLSLGRARRFGGRGTPTTAPPPPPFRLPPCALGRRRSWRPDLPPVAAATPHCGARVAGLDGAQPGDDLFDRQVTGYDGQRLRLRLRRRRRGGVTFLAALESKISRASCTRCCQRRHAGHGPRSGQASLSSKLDPCQSAGVTHSEHMSLAVNGGIASRNSRRRVSLRSASRRGRARTGPCSPRVRPGGP